MKQAGQNAYLEIGSHSFSHKKIVGESPETYEREITGSKEVLEKLSGKKVIGFRPPREEIDDRMVDLLEESGYRYIFNRSENRLTPYLKEDTLIIPRHGTDDYDFLVKLDWNDKKILSTIIEEAETVTRLNGIYTLSTHTHLLNYGSNIHITESFFRHVKNHPRLHAMNGRMIYRRINQRKHLKFETEVTKNKLILTMGNDLYEPIENLHIKIFTQPGVRLKKIESEKIGNVAHLKHDKAGTYTVVVEKIKPKSQAIFFINYETDR